MDITTADTSVSSIAAAIGEPARASILTSLLDGRARTATELAVVANVSPSTTSAHLRKLEQQRLVSLVVQGKHRYYSLAGAPVASALEALNVLAGSGARFVPDTPKRLRFARTCYDHVAGALGVLLHDRFRQRGWLQPSGDRSYEVTRDGAASFRQIGIDTDALHRLRRHFATACLDWSERRDHLGGAVGAAVLGAMLKRRWLTRDLDSRIVEVTPIGRRALEQWAGVDLRATPPRETRPVD
jgi:DNA-binding transcriptional ArsR family regulator